MDTDMKLQALWSNNMVVAADVAGMRLVNERLATEGEHLRVDLKVARARYEKECLVVEKLMLMFLTYRTEFGAEVKQWEWTRRPWLRAPLWWSTVCALPWSSTRRPCRRPSPGSKVLQTSWRRS